MTDKQAAPKQRVSDEDIAMWLAEADHDGEYYVEFDAMLLDLREARSALSRCSDYAATLGIENDGLRRITGEMRDNGARDMKAYNALREAVEARAQRLDAQGKYTEANYLYDMIQSGGGESRGVDEPTDREADKDGNEADDRPAAQILVRDGEPWRRATQDEINSGSILLWFHVDEYWLELTKDDPLWPVWEAWKPTIPSPWPSIISCDGIYDVVECEACDGSGDAYTTIGINSKMRIDCLTCGGTGKTLQRSCSTSETSTLKRAEDQHE